MEYFYIIRRSVTFFEIAILFSITFFLIKHTLI